jgi:hypothetical protein
VSGSPALRARASRGGGEHARLLAARARSSARCWVRAQRRIEGAQSSWWRDAERAIAGAALPEALGAEAPAVALGAELDELTALQAHCDAAQRGDARAREALIDRLASGEHLT